jgi:hypothetical protein
MFSLTRVITVTAAGALVALTAASSARAEDSAQGPHQPILTTVGQADLKLGECHLRRRAISRRACQARLRDELHIDTAENK